ncbi:MAG TPA: YggT family protein [Candidatus Dormibacteraeota bacterium]|nr:YggT family protein [Candidatus Dormibacteraeota bacterium]
MILVIGLLVWIIRIFVLLVFIRVLLGWISPYPRNSFMRFFWVVTEPVLAPIRRALPYVGGFDLSPLVVWLAAIILTAVLQSFTA